MATIQESETLTKILWKYLDPNTTEIVKEYIISDEAIFDLVASISTQMRDYMKFMDEWPPLHVHQVTSYKIKDQKCKMITDGLIATSGQLSEFFQTYNRPSACAPIYTKQLSKYRSVIGATPEGNRNLF